MIAALVLLGMTVVIFTAAWIIGELLFGISSDEDSGTDQKMVEKP